jgi:hypothetical protein
MGWPIPKGMDVAHDGNGYEPKGWLISAYCWLILLPYLLSNV